MLKDIGTICIEGGVVEKYRINKWHLRVVNSAGDFSNLMLDTISFHLSKGEPILEYDVIKRNDGTLQFTPANIERSSSLITETDGLCRA